jgi:uncharacterized protein (TIGR00255 family)
MTGFARAEGGLEDLSWVWELRSVNAKGLDLRFRPPPGFEALDPLVRATVNKRFKRGSVSVNLQTRRETGGGAYRINEDFLGQVVARLDKLKAEVPDARPPSLDGILGLRGVIEPVDQMMAEDAFEATAKAMMADLDAALSGLAAMRDEEGGRLLAVLNGQISQVADLTERAAAVAGAQPDAIRQRLNDQLARLVADNPAMPEERLAQEAAILMTKADIREEIDRLTAHTEAARELLEKADGAVGRRLDFLCQEFNREANTLCSKSPDTELTALGLDLKAVIDQLREQVQNIE